MSPGKANFMTEKAWGIWGLRSKEVKRERGSGVSECRELDIVENWPNLGSGPDNRSGGFSTSNRGSTSSL